eukprot:TRINITY_DN6648_c0_g1_i6.p1 TRINITY_DN6648_c0_g1~~TRINITY_DN6648_c0_g1_i6.p1  ORF type:complete len:583 (-),score=82.62 TRINITY_DN6648_c0_g1_i6:202-1950(-)
MAELNRQLSIRQRRNQYKDNFLQSLGKLSDRDTEQIGFQELGQYIVECNDLEDLSVAVNAFTSINTESPTFTRKDTLKLIEFLLTTANPQQAQLISSRYLQKIVGYVKGKFIDPDPAVRELSGITLGKIAGHVSASKGESNKTITSQILECMASQNSNISCMATISLLNYSTSDFPPDLTDAQVKQLLKLLNSQHFLGKANLLKSICQYVDQVHGETTGIGLTNWSLFGQFCSHIIGSFSLHGTKKKPSAGLIVCFKDKEWQTRYSAIECLGALLETLGPDELQIRENVQDILDAEECLKSDKVKQVRELGSQIRPILLLVKNFKKGDDWPNYLKSQKLSEQQEAPAKRPQSAFKSSLKRASTFKREIESDFLISLSQNASENEQLPTIKQSEEVNSQEQKQDSNYASLQDQVHRLMDMVDRLSQYSVDAVTKLQERIEKLEHQVQDKETPSENNSEIQTPQQGSYLNENEREVLNALQLGDDEILKLLQNDLSIWENLSDELLASLLRKVLSVFNRQGSSIIVIRSLWRLADLENKQVQVSKNLQEQIIQSLSESDFEEELQESAAMLLETFQRVWTKADD